MSKAIKYTEKNPLVAYKGFEKGPNGDKICRNHVFELGKTYSVTGAIQLCGNGFHACKKPSEVFNHYHQNIGNAYAIVHQWGTIKKDSSKHCSKYIKVIKFISEKELLALDKLYTTVVNSKELIYQRYVGDDHFINKVKGAIVSIEQYGNVVCTSEGENAIIIGQFTKAKGAKGCKFASTMADNVLEIGKNGIKENTLYKVIKKKWVECK